MSSTDSVTKADGEHTTHVAAGHKANLSNPNTSDASKEHSREVLKDLEGKDADVPVVTDKNALAGHKAAVHNPNVSEEAKAHSQAILDKST